MPWLDKSKLGKRPPSYHINVASRKTGRARYRHSDDTQSPEVAHFVREEGGHRYYVWGDANGPLAHPLSGKHEELSDDELTGFQHMMHSPGWVPAD